ncbi:hypothetical protein VTI28DRAFT_1470 [Corynascus sepedonium]
MGNAAFTRFPAQVPHSHLFILMTGPIDQSSPTWTHFGCVPFTRRVGASPSKDWPSPCCCPTESETPLHRSNE